jgi:hypothetical protein
MKHSLPIWFLLAALGVISCMAQAQTAFDLGGRPGAPFRLGFSGRGMARANTLSTVTNEDGLSYYNPAIVPFQADPTATVSVGFLSFDRNLNFASYTQRLKPSGGFSIAVINAGVSDLVGRDRNGQATETYSTSENEFLFSFGLKFEDNFSIGVSTKILYFSLFEGVKSTTVGFDVGTLYSIGPEWVLAAVVGDINSKYKWDTSRLYGQEGTATIDRFPLRRKLAVAYHPQALGGTISAEIEWIGSVVLGRIGAEYRLHESFSVYGGIDQIDAGRAIDSKPGIGFSLRIPKVPWESTIHYGFILEPYSPGGIHMVTLMMRFK